MTATVDTAGKRTSRFVVMMGWDDTAGLEASLGSQIGQRTAEDATANLARYATFGGMIPDLDEVWSRTPPPREGACVVDGG